MAESEKRPAELKNNTAEAGKEFTQLSDEELTQVAGGRGKGTVRPGTRTPGSTGLPKRD